MKRPVLIVYFTSLLFYGYSQDNDWMVGEISNEICAKINQLKPKEASHQEIEKIFYGTILQYQDAWNKFLDGLPNSSSPNARFSFYNQTINHRLLLDCPAFRDFDDSIDKSFRGDTIRRPYYLAAKEFIVSAELANEPSELKRFFPDISKNLESTIDTLINELNHYSLTSNIYIINVHNSFNYFINIYDYKTGSENLTVNIEFKDSSDLLIDGLSIKTKDKIEVEAAQVEELDLDGIITPPPTD